MRMCRRGRAQAGDPRLRFTVILLTAADSSSMRAEAKRRGAASYFRKPVDHQALSDSIAWSMNEHQP
jgi:FixJ family two-component response regulator